MLLAIILYRLVSTAGYLSGFQSSESAFVVIWIRKSSNYKGVCPQGRAGVAQRSRICFPYASWTQSGPVVCFRLSQIIPTESGVHVCLVTQLCLTLWPQGTVARQAPLSMGILQARILKGVVIPSFRGSSQPRDWTQVSCIAARFFTVWATFKRGIVAQIYRWQNWWSKDEVTCLGTVMADTEDLITS